MLMYQKVWLLVCLDRKFANEKFKQNYTRERTFCRKKFQAIIFDVNSTQWCPIYRVVHIDTIVIDSQFKY